MIKKIILLISVILLIALIVVWQIVMKNHHSTLPPLTTINHLASTPPKTHTDIILTSPAATMTKNIVEVPAPQQKEQPTPHTPTLPTPTIDLPPATPKQKNIQPSPITPPAQAQLKVQAQPQQEHFHTALHYHVSWTTIPVADVYAGIETLKNGDLSVRIIIRGAGIADMAGGYKSDSTAVQSPIATNHGYRPVQYDSIFKLRGDWRTIALTYSPDGSTITNELNTPPEKRWKRKEVDSNDKQSSFNPITAGVVAREIIRRFIAAHDGNTEENTTFTLPMYDGRRRSDLVFTLQKPIGHKNIIVKLKEIPVAGFTNNELKSFAEYERVIHLELSPETLLPLKATGITTIGTAEATLRQQCDTLEACMPKE